jgi:hypothetical protein
VPMSNYLREQLAAHVWNGTPYLPPTGFEVQLHTGAPGDDCDQNVAVNGTRATVSWSPQFDGTSENADEINFFTLPLSETWTHFSVWDDNDHPLGWDEFDLAFPVLAGDTASFAEGALTLNLV